MILANGDWSGISLKPFSHVALVNTALRLGHFAEPVLAFRGLEKTA
jgi:hypothetical protein